MAWDIVYLLTEVKFAKKIEGPNLGQTGQNWAQNKVFHHFQKFGLLAFQEIA